MNDYFKEMVGRALSGLLLAGLIVIVLWSLAVRFLPDGWWITLINVLGFLSTILIIGLGSWQTLKMAVPSGVAFLVGSLMWVAMVIGLRSLLLNLLGG